MLEKPEWNDLLDHIRRWLRLEISDAQMISYCRDDTEWAESETQEAAFALADRIELGL